MMVEGNRKSGCHCITKLICLSVMCNGFLQGSANSMFGIVGGKMNCTAA